ncbi:DNA-binding CsgD family transcriptional regulator/tetratricopeptide (TPR) repeat protein [Streptomyces achromogenes]|uniref:DNA-binding CsgD family transcriptional regulator/tetratricopeptide (TPR) repeat protein n=1 Tax=Streptomyces achromogenes TaxID=67255 RepID=A0ABU0Q6Y5_STRAH|nr:AAA family ATPase [Streptomyces achromogenes]MDQ0686439.1 DNA-binding CsgD family transcriptional regulator/tetratricopeptide (TPR) repeat protein [Streptomyces achromogenes]MDQ0833568.1 DNA-binding CsgD family transcriptional regulator/tetratricopeptide (TPR) repeat protein [Streptomyces achromogenes]
MLAPVETRSVSPVFVGRSDELDILHGALSRAAAGEPQALLVGGEAGVGKTRLVEEFAATAGRGDAVVAVGGCVEIGADGLPFAPFSTALRALRRALPDAFAAAAAGQEDELARLLPECGKSTAARHDEEGMARLFELVARLLERLAADRTVVLALEDLHWADASTRHLLSYLLRTLRTGRLVVLATYRADDIHRRHPLRPLLAELDRLRTVRRLELARFTRDEVGRQIAGILAREPDPAQVDAIFERSDGNAFFVEELAVAAGEGCRTGLTDSLRDLLLVRVETLPDSAQNVARIVAEGGSTVEYRLLDAVARLAEDELIEALRAAVNAHLLLAVPDGDGYRFRHSLVREAVSDDLLPGERSRLNRRYAEALQADPTLVPADERVMRLAGYWYHAHDPAKALPAVLDASVEARSRRAYSEQLRFLERAMELWEGAPEEVRAALRPIGHTEAYPPGPPERHGGTPGGRDPATIALRYLDLMAEATVAGRYCGERERALKIAKRALRLLADGDGDPLRAAWFWVQRSRLVRSLGRGGGREELARAEELLRGLPPSEVHAEVLAHVAGWSALHVPGPDAYRAAERAVEYARMVGARETELKARQILGILMVDAGDIEPGLTELSEVKDRALAEDIPTVALDAYVNLPSELEAVGRSREAVAIMAEGLAYAERQGLPDTEAWVHGNLAESLLSLGRWDEADRASAEAGRIARGVGPKGAHATLRAELALARGDLAEAGRRLAAAHGYVGSREHMPQDRLPLARLAIALAVAEDRPADVRAHLEHALDVGFPPGAQRYAWPLLLTAASAVIAVPAVNAIPAAGNGVPAVTAAAGTDAGLPARIRRAAKRLVAIAPVWRAHALWLHAELARAEGRNDPDDWAEVVAAFECLDRPYDLARARHRMAEALLASGGDAERDRAAELLRLAHAVAAHLGARPLADAVALLGRRARLSRSTAAGPPDIPAGPGDPIAALGLTSRERDVLRLVSAGRTNRQIAEELFISPKTASVHVSNILSKLDVSGRGEAAAVAHRLGLFPPTARDGPIAR